VLESPLDAGDHLLESFSRVEGSGRRQLAVVLADDVLRRPRLTRRSALVVEDAHDGPVVDERVEQDRARVADDGVSVLEEDGELLEVRVARLLNVHARSSGGGAESLAPLAVARVRPEQELEAILGGLLPPGEDALDEAALVGRVRRRVSHQQDERSARVEPVLAEERLVVGSRAGAPEDVGLRPARHAYPLRIDVVISAQVVFHDPVLDDVQVAVRRDDTFAHRMVPARHVGDDGEAQAAGGTEKRNCRMRLDVREDERRALPLHRLAQPARHVPVSAEVPALHSALEEPPPRERAIAVGVEHPVRVPCVHALQMEPVPQIEPDREGVVPDLAIEPGVEPACQAVSRAGDEVVAEEHGCVSEPRAPLRRLLPRHEEDRAERRSEPVAKPVDDPGVEEDADRKLVGKDEPGALHAYRAPSLTAIRRASDAPSSSWKASASSGVPHAGQPSTP
jgi:hypothetical protein